MIDDRRRRPPPVPGDRPRREDLATRAGRVEGLDEGLRRELRIGEQARAALEEVDPALGLELQLADLVVELRGQPLARLAIDHREHARDVAGVLEVVAIVEKAVDDEPPIALAILEACRAGRLVAILADRGPAVGGVVVGARQSRRADAQRGGLRQRRARGARHAEGG